MRQWLRIIFSVFLLWGGGASPGAAEKVDPALFGALPAIADVEISPDGNTIAVLQDRAGSKQLVFVDLSNQRMQPKGVEVGDVKARGLRWVGNDFVLLLTSTIKNTNVTSGMEKIEFWRWVSISKDDLKLRLLFQRDNNYFIGSAGRLMASTPDDPGFAVFARRSPDAQIGQPTTGLSGRFGNRDDVLGLSLFRVNLATGSRRITYRGNFNTVEWVVDQKGEAVLRIDYDEKKQVRKIYRRRQGNSTFDLVNEVRELKGEESKFEFYGMSQNREEIFAASAQGRDTKALFAFDIDTMELARTVFESDEHDIDYVRYDPRTASVSAVGYTPEMPRDINFVPSLKATHDALAVSLSNPSISIVSNSADNSKLLLEAYHSDRPTEIYLFDTESNSLALFSSVNPALSNRIYAQKEEFDHTTEDGLYINGYLTTPHDVEESNLPLIVLPHSGAESRDDKMFDWWSAFYAARGYAVYQPNFRGSYGYGLQFREAAYGEWGRKMQSDIVSGVRKLIGDGIVDPSRICIVGSSYGGYAALIGTINTPDLFKCAVSVNGISDLPTMIGQSGRVRLTDLRISWWETRIGSRFRDSEELAAVSPARRTANVGAPIMLIHGKDDTVVPFYQSEIMRDALAAAGKPHEFIELNGGDHWLSSGKTRTEMLRTSIEFIDKHIGGNK